MKFDFDKLNIELGNILAPEYLKHGFKRLDNTCVFEHNNGASETTANLGPRAKFDTYTIYQPIFHVDNFKISSVAKELVGVLTGEPTAVGISSQKEMANFSGSTEYDGWTDYRMRSEDDVTKMAEHHLKFMHNIGFPMIARMDYHGISQWANRVFFDLDTAEMSVDNKTKLIRKSPLTYAIFGTIAAWFDKDPRFDQLASTYRDLFYLPHLYEKIDLVLNELPKRYPQ